MDDAITNPLYGVQTGSIVFADSGRFGVPVLNPGLTQFDHQSSSTMSMTGNSSYLYSDHMNQGSLSLAGSWGIGGVGRMSSAVSSYVGNTHSESAKTLSITLNAAKAAGFEYVDFNNLSMAQFIAGLKDNVRRDMTDVLAKYLEVDVDKPDTFSPWTEAVDRFLAAHGTGIVVGTLWGGWGAVNLTFSGRSSTDKWVYGGSAELSYAGTGWSGEISATYGGSKQNLGEDATAGVSMYCNGASMEGITQKWFEDLSKAAKEGLDKVGDKKVDAPLLSESLPRPKPPEFRAPKEDDSVAKKIKDIKDLKGLEAFAAVSAYDKYKKDGGEQGLDQFLEARKAPNNVDALQRALDLLNDWDDADALDDSGSLYAESDADRWTSDDGAVDDPNAGGGSGILGAGGADVPLPPPDFSSYAPMGVWVANWSQLFPWLVSGQNNQVQVLASPAAPVPSGSGPVAMYKLRVLQQDFLTLARLYRLFARNSRLKVQPMTDSISFVAIADDFTGGASQISDFISATAKGKGSDPEKQLATRIDRLGSYSKRILEMWRSFGFLRNAGLGLGITLYTPGLKPSSFKTFPDGDERARRQPNLIECAFEWDNRNYEVFAEYVKGWPLIFTDKNNQPRIVCYVEGPNQDNCGILACDPPNAYGNHNFYVWRDITPDNSTPRATDAPQAIFFGLPPAGDIMKLPHLFGPLNRRDGAYVRVWPIPYHAANGITWLGQTMAAGDGGLREQVSDAVAALGEMECWSLDSSHWKGLSLDSGFAPKAIHPSYVGVIKEPTNSPFG